MGGSPARIDDGFAFHVDALVVVPFIFGRDDAVADEDDGRVGDIDGGFGLRGGHPVILPAVSGKSASPDLTVISPPPAVMPQSATGCSQEPSGLPGVSFRSLALRDDVVEAFLLAGRAGSAAFELVG